MPRAVIFMKCLFGTDELKFPPNPGGFAIINIKVTAKIVIQKSARARSESVSQFVCFLRGSDLEPPAIRPLYPRNNCVFLLIVSVPSCGH